MGPEISHLGAKENNNNNQVPKKCSDGNDGVTTHLLYKQLLHHVTPHEIARQFLKESLIMQQSASAKSSYKWISTGSS